MNLTERVFFFFVFVGWLRMFWIFDFFEIVFESSGLCESVPLLWVVVVVVFLCFVLFDRVFWALQVVSSCF